MSKKPTRESEREMKEIRESRHYGMFTDEGNERLKKVLRATLNGDLYTDAFVAEWSADVYGVAPTLPYECDCGAVREGVAVDFVDAVQERVLHHGMGDTFNEVYDTVVRENIVEEIAYVFDAKMVLVSA
jgi:hypothetical protein